jgi:hypothetical protein
LRDYNPAVRAVNARKKCSWRSKERPHEITPSTVATPTQEVDVRRIRHRIRI